MTGFVNEAIPFILYGNRQCLTDQQIKQFPWVAEFVARFRHCFERDDVRQILIYNPRQPTDLNHIDPFR